MVCPILMVALAGELLLPRSEEGLGSRREHAGARKAIATSKVEIVANLGTVPPGMAIGMIARAKRLGPHGAKSPHDGFKGTGDAMWHRVDDGNEKDAIDRRRGRFGDIAGYIRHELNEQGAVDG